MKRREFIKTGVTGAGVAAAAGVGVGVLHAAPVGPAGTANPDATHGSIGPHDLLRVTDPGERRGDMLYRTLGRTGQKVSLIGMGRAHLSRKPLDEICEAGFARSRMANDAQRARKAASTAATT